MQEYDYKTAVLSIAANAATESVTPNKSMTEAAISYKSGLTDKSAFLAKCGKNTLFAKLVIYTDSRNSEFDSDEFLKLHKMLYEPKLKCGEIRVGDLTVTGGSCTAPKLLRGSLKSALGKMQQTAGAPEITKADFAAQLSCFMRELIILSPFTYGNAITRRAFIMQFCLMRGFMLNYAAASKAELLAAESEAFTADASQPLFNLFMKCLSYLQEEKTAKQTHPAQKAAALNKSRAAAQEIASSVAAVKPREAVRAQQPVKPVTPPPRTKAEPVKREPPVKQSAQAKPPAGAKQTPPVKQSPPIKQIAPAVMSAEKAEVMRDLRDIQKSLNSLAVRIAEISDKVEKMK